MRGGYKVFDADTHFQPSVESILPYLDKELRDREKEFEQFKRPVKIGRAGQVLEPPYRHWYRFPSRADDGWGARKPRHLGEAGPREQEERHFQQFMGSRYPALGVEDYDVATRIREMDEEGVDTQLMVTSPFVGHEDPTVEMGFIRALHRYLDDVCRQYPGRLTSMITVTPRAVEESVAEIETWAKAPWAVAVKPELPVEYPLDHPDLHPVWQAVNRHGLCVAHHSFAAGYPGYRDLWDNPFIGRTASHPWAAMRAIAAFLGAGLFDRYPDLRFAILESGFGWLPFWMKRMKTRWFTWATWPRGSGTA